MKGKLTERTISNFIVEFYRKADEKYGGDTSINELRVVAYCYQANSYEDEVSVTRLAEVLNMPTSTVHRAVTNLIRKGWLCDKPHPNDGRRRIIELTDKAVAGDIRTLGVQWIEKYLEPDV